jgi:hypothetical protein
MFLSFSSPAAAVTAGTHVDGSVAGRTAHMWLSSSLMAQAAVLGIEPKASQHWTARMQHPAFAAGCVVAHALAAEHSVQLQ